MVRAVLNRLQPKTIIRANITRLDPNQMLKERCAFITGGTSGIGYSIAEAYLEAGAKVVIAGRSQSKIQAAVEKLAQIGSCCGIVMDVSE